jgi:hypothetical protein
VASVKRGTRDDVRGPNEPGWRALAGWAHHLFSFGPRAPLPRASLAYGASPGEKLIRYFFLQFLGVQKIPKTIFKKEIFRLSGIRYQ